MDREPYLRQAVFASLDNLGRLNRRVLTTNSDREQIQQAIRTVGGSIVHEEVHYRDNFLNMTHEEFREEVARLSRLWHGDLRHI